MMNPTYHFARMRELLDEFQPSRERSLAATKIDEAEMWLARCTPTEEAAGRDQESRRPAEEVVPEAEFIESTDAMVWARAFCSRVRAGLDATDEGWLVGWFASAMAAQERASSG